MELLEKLMKELPEMLQRNTELLNENERMLRQGLLIFKRKHGKPSFFVKSCKRTGTGTK